MELEAADNKQGMAKWVCLILGVFFLASTFGLTSDLWYDEVITLVDFAIGPSEKGDLLKLIRSYPIPNNHVLFSVLMWFWVRIIDFRFYEPLLRLPALLFFMAMLTIILTCWRKFIGRNRAIVLATALATGPVLTSFAWQFRGYSLSLLFVVTALTGLLIWNEKPSWKATAWIGISFFLLPIVIPTNVLVMAPIYWACCFSGKFSKEKLRYLVVITLLAVLGGSYYLTVLTQFLGAIKNTGGWDSKWWLSLHLIIASCLEFLVMAICVYKNKSKGILSQTVMRYLGLGSLLMITVFILVLKQAPYPRVFIVFYPLFGLMIVSFLDNKLPFKQLKIAVAFMILIGMGSTVLCDKYTKKRLNEGKYCQDLLFQAYKGNGRISSLTRMIKEQFGDTSLYVICSAQIEPALSYYMGLRDYPPKTVAFTGREKYVDIYLNSGKTVIAVMTKGDDSLKNLNVSVSPVLFSYNGLEVYQVQKN